MNGMIYIVIFWCTAPNCIHSKEALQEAKVECLEAEVEYLKAEAELLAAQTNRYD